MNFKILKKSLILCLLISTTIGVKVPSFGAEEQVYGNKLIVLYVTSQDQFKLQTTEQISTGTLPFETVLSNAVQKLVASGEITPNQITTNQNISPVKTNDVAFVESNLDKLHTYIVKVNDQSNIEAIKQALKNENGVLKVTRDFKVIVPDTFKLQTENTIQSCNLVPTCTPIGVVCSQGTPTCPQGSRIVCLFQTDKPPTPACLGNGMLSISDLYCEVGFGPPQKLPDDPYNEENWHYERTGLASTWNMICNCPPDISKTNCNVKDHPEFCNVGDPNIIIAVLDNGFSVGAQPGTTGNPDLIGRFDLNTNRDVIL